MKERQTKMVDTGESTKLPIVVFEERKEAAITLPAAPDKLKAVEVTFKLHLHC